MDLTLPRNYDRTQDYMKSPYTSRYSKTGWSYIWYNANGTDQMNLYSQGFKYYTKRKLGAFGSNLILKVVNTLDLKGKLMCVCINTLNMQFIIPADEVLVQQMGQ